MLGDFEEAFGGHLGSSATFGDFACSIASLAKVSVMPNHVLLLGAGFSRNWNAPLASEVTISLLEQVGGDAYLRALLRRHSNNFENALSEVQRDHLHALSSAEAEERLVCLPGAISTMFGRLNATFEPPREFEFCNEREYSVSRFLAMFDSIFNLNQDLLLDMRYSIQILTASGHRWGSFESPGMRPVPDPALTGIGDSHRRRWTPIQPPFSSNDRIQPHFKIHGSSNWATADGRNPLVMGGDKEFMIREHQVLRWYYEQFLQRLAIGGTRLMVIGYSFSDRHINVRNACVHGFQRLPLNVELYVGHRIASGRTAWESNFDAINRIGSCPSYPVSWETGQFMDGLVAPKSIRQ
jgi:hypothetical protein